jgi:putative membrane protein
MMMGLGVTHLFVQPFLGGGMVISMMLVWILAGLLVAWAVSAATMKPASQGYDPASPVENDPALAIVRQRYARGEISRGEYERLVAGLLAAR